MKLYRGIRVKKLNSLRDPVGIHWTTSLDIALEFTKGSGIIIIADIAEEDIVKFGTTEWEQYQYKYDMFNEGHRECEKTVRKGTRIHISSIVEVNNNRMKKVSVDLNRTV